MTSESIRYWILSNSWARLRFIRSMASWQRLLLAAASGTPCAIPIGLTRFSFYDIWAMFPVEASCDQLLIFLLVHGYKAKLTTQNHGTCMKFPIDNHSSPNSLCQWQHRLHFHPRMQPAVHLVQHSWHHFLDGQVAGDEQGLHHETMDVRNGTTLNHSVSWLTAPGTLIYNPTIVLFWQALV